MKVRYSNRLAAAIVVAINTPQVSVAQSTSSANGQQEIEEIVVSGAFKTTKAETLLPISVITGDEYRQRVTNSLGDTLKNEIGINNSSYGTGVGLTDHSRPDRQPYQYFWDCEPMLPIRVIGSPAFVSRWRRNSSWSIYLAGSGAIGGVVNVLDSRIPEQMIDQTNFQLEQLQLCERGRQDCDAGGASFGNAECI